MKKQLRLLLAVVFGVALLGVTVSADPGKGEKILNKMFMRAGGCDVPAPRVALAHSLAEWKAIYASGKMEEEIQKLCPHMKPMAKIEKPKYAQDVFEYMEHYANDSGAIPA